MEKEPQDENKQTRYIPSELSTPAFLYELKYAEASLKNPELSRTQIHATMNYFEQVLTSFIPAEYLNSPVDLIGRAYFADARGQLINDGDGVTKCDIISASPNFIGIQLLPLRDGSGKRSYKAYCRFSTAGDHQTESETLFVAPEDMIVFQPTSGFADDTEDNETEAIITYDEENEIIKSIFKQQAQDSHTILTSPHFTGATGKEQRRILEICAKKATEFVQSEYGHQTIEVKANEFFVATESGIDYVDQSSKPDDEMNILVGEVVECTFIELVQLKPDAKIESMHRHHPSMVLHNYETGSYYMVPILAFESAKIIED